MKRYEWTAGRYVPCDINGEPTLCKCKPWQLCTACGLYEHSGSYCSWCGSKTTLERLANRPNFSRDILRGSRLVQSATTIGDPA
jgi:hypothetical protein